MDTFTAIKLQENPKLLDWTGNTTSIVGDWRSHMTLSTFLRNGPVMSLPFNITTDLFHNIFSSFSFFPSSVMWSYLTFWHVGGGISFSPGEYQPCWKNRQAVRAHNVALPEVCSCKCEHSVSSHSALCRMSRALLLSTCLRAPANSFTVPPDTCQQVHWG